MTKSFPVESHLVTLFEDVLRCRRCSIDCVKRNEGYDIPQPGWVGRRFEGLMFVGQNPGEGRTPPTEPDRKYLEALRNVSDRASLNDMHDRLKEASDTFAYYNSFHFDVDIERVAYINAVRCRTVGNSLPRKSVIENCRRHFLTWIEYLQPKGVVFLGVFAHRATADLLDQRGINHVVISRQRSLSREKRIRQDTLAREFISNVLTATKRK